MRNHAGRAPAGGRALLRRSRPAGEDGRCHHRPIAPRRPNPSTDVPQLARQAPATTPQARQSWAQQMFGYPDVTGAISENTPAEPQPAPKGNRPGAVNPEPTPAGTPVPLERTPSAA